jgi:hypothetical protein
VQHSAKTAFAECNPKNTRQSWKNEVNFGQFPTFAECWGSRHLAKNFLKKNLCRVPYSGALGKEFFKKKSLPSARQRSTRQTNFFKKIFCLPSARMVSTWQKKFQFFSLPSAMRWALGKEILKKYFMCRVP